MELYESVPNVSCGRDASVIATLSAKLKSVDGCRLLHVDSGYDADRTVFTLVGSPDALFEATVLLYKSACKLIDMRNYKGNHPAIGAVDVCPFVPLSEGASMDVCKDLSRRLAFIVAQDLEIPVFLYRESAASQERCELSAIRRGGIVGLRSRVSEEGWRPDYGSTVIHERFGATAIGARPVLIAYNVNIRTGDVRVAKRIAAQIRESAAGEYALRACRALGWYLETCQIAQVSVNLNDYRITGLAQVYETVRQLAERECVEVSGSEIIGLVPMGALVAAAAYFEPALCLNESESIDLCDRATKFLGLNDTAPFVPSERIIEMLCG